MLEINKIHLGDSYQLMKFLTIQLIWCILTHYLIHAGGSGTTAIACDDLHRSFIAIEIDEKYHSLSTERLEAEQSQKKLF